MKIEIDGLVLSHERTDRFSAPRFVEDAQLPHDFARRLVRPAPELPHIAQVFVDPREWTFRTFENIVRLDGMFADARITLGDRETLGPEIDRFRLSGADELRELDRLPFYVTPANASSRGGLRYIFHHARLAEQLTTSLRAVMPAGFSHVNPVFRCNRFEPGDEPFHRHLDTPYFDAERHHVSRYTLLIYLTGGRGTPALRIEDIAIEQIEPLTCVVFHQILEHAGHAFVDGRKVFLRTELIFEDNSVTHAPRIAQLFAKACYLTGETIRDPALGADADRAYNEVAAAHWTGDVATRSDAFVHKRYRGVQWLANGYDFWFANHVPLLECAAVTLVDYFNCKIAGQPFRSLCTSTTLRDVDVDTVVANFAPAEPAITALDKSLLFPPPERETCCCHLHSGSRWDATTADEIVGLLGGAQRFAKARIGPAPICILGQEVFLDPSRFVVHGNQIHVLSRDRLAPVNFAACRWDSEPQNYLDIDVSAHVLQPLVPPILFEATPRGWHLMFDFFRNSWAVSLREYDVPVPRVHADIDGETADALGERWINAARTADVNPKAPEPRSRPWWAGYGTIYNEILAED